MSDSPASSPLRPPRRPPRPPLFPYTTLFRSVHGLLPRRPAERGSGMTQQPSILVVDDEMGILDVRSEEHTSELQSRGHLVCRLLLEKKENRTVSTNRIPYAKPERGAGRTAPS